MVTKDFETGAIDNDISCYLVIKRAKVGSVVHVVERVVSDLVPVQGEAKVELSEWLKFGLYVAGPVWLRHSSKFFLARYSASCLGASRDRSEPRNLALPNQSECRTL